ncbi:MAG: fructosamine kinase family protein [Bacteroidetes bacterium]|nr:fructosamine kinase family protein [Bacteroidota bacterium]
MIPSIIEDKLRELLLEKNHSSFVLQSVSPMSGGSINQSFKLETKDVKYFLKYNLSDRYPHMFEAEYRGLELLREKGNLRVPSPILTGQAGTYTFILMEYIWQGSFAADFWDDFGAKLAGLHRNTQSYFGLNHHNYMGSLPQDNTAHDDWISFFIEERLEKQLKFGLNEGTLPSSMIKKFERLYRRLEEIFPAEPPALLHGDLWSGNFMIDPEGKVCVMDPAVYYGHREADLAMTKLFGGFTPSFYEAYHSEFPLQPAWRDRMEIYNLYPLLVHANLFGGSYLRSVENILQMF